MCDDNIGQLTLYCTNTFADLFVSFSSIFFHRLYFIFIINDERHSLAFGWPLLFSTKKLVINFPRQANMSACFDRAAHTILFTWVSLNYFHTIKFLFYITKTLFIGLYECGHFIQIFLNWFRLILNWNWNRFHIIWLKFVSIFKFKSAQLDLISLGYFNAIESLKSKQLNHQNWNSFDAFYLLWADNGEKFRAKESVNYCKNSSITKIMYWADLQKNELLWKWSKLK